MSLVRSLWISSLLAAGCTLGGGDSGPARDPTLELVTLVETPASTAEDLSLRERDRLLLVSHSAEGTASLFSLDDPAAPALRLTIDLRLAEGEELTSVALHPRWDYLLAAVRAAGPLTRGRLEFYDLSGGRKLGDLEVGVAPDCVRIDPTGRNAMVANEAEAWVQGEQGSLRSAAGSLSLVELGPDPTTARARELRLPELGAVAGAVVASDGRFLPRRVDGEARLVPLSADSAQLVEPEYIAFDSTGDRAFVTLQENNAVVVVATRTGEVLAVHGLGRTEHAADTADDGTYEPTGAFLALREPDGITLTTDDEFFLTADEGDTEPKASSVEAGKPAGGGRTVSIFDAATGRLLGDTGNQLDEAASSAGIYPDTRSDNKGSEPELVTAFRIGTGSYAAVGLERASAVALIDIADPEHPRVVAIASLGTIQPHGPEGLVHFLDPATSTHYLYTANEVSGTLGVLRVVP